VSEATSMMSATMRIAFGLGVVQPMQQMPVPSICIWRQHLHRPLPLLLQPKLALNELREWEEDRKLHTMMPSHTL